jgi:hypothetical protein
MFRVAHVPVVFALSEESALDTYIYYCANTCYTNLILAYRLVAVRFAICLVRIYAFFELGNLLQGIQSLGLLAHDLSMVNLSWI